MEERGAELTSFLQSRVDSSEVHAKSNAIRDLCVSWVDCVGGTGRNDLSIDSMQASDGFQM